MVTIFFTDVLQCIPIRKIFYANLEGKCIDTVSFFIATAALTILTDILVMMIPTWITWNLQLTIKKKLAVIFLLSMGLLVTGISVYRLYYLIDAYYGPPIPDAMYGVGGTASSIEVNLAIAAACGPFLKPVIISIFPGFFGRESAREYYEYHDGPGSDVLGYYGGPNASAYTASASASARRHSNGVPTLRGGAARDSTIELQKPGERIRKSLRRANTTPSTRVREEEEDRDDSSQRRIVTTEEARDMDHGLQSNGRGSKKSRHGKDGIMRKTSVNISYSPKDSDETPRLKDAGALAH